MGRSFLTPFLAAIAAIVAATGCMETNYYESAAKLSSDCAKITAPASTEAEGSTISASVEIRSNRSWSASLPAEAGWVRLSADHHLNLSGVEEATTLTLSFDEYDVRESRQVMLSVTTENRKLTIPVVQSAFVPQLSVSTPTVFDDISFEGDTLLVCVVTNCAWEAAIKPGATADAVPDRTKGFRNDSLYVTVGRNTDTAAGKTATLVLSTPGHEDVEVVFNQQKYSLDPFLKIDRSPKRTMVPAPGGNIPVPFSTNENWTASLKDISGSGISLSSESGSQDDGLTISFPEKLNNQGASLDRNSATVVILTESGLTDEVTFIQHGCLLHSFRKFESFPETAGWTLTANNLYVAKGSGKLLIPRYNGGRTGKCVYVEACEGVTTSTGALSGEKTHEGWSPEGYRYVFWAGPGLSTDDGGMGMLYCEAQGLVIGSDKAGLTPLDPAYYIETPAIEGKRLVRVQIMLGMSDETMGLKNWEKYATGKSTAIVTADGSAVVSGGELQSARSFDCTANVPSDFQDEFANHKESLLDFILSDTPAGASCRIVGTYRQVIRWWILYFE